MISNFHRTIIPAAACVVLASALLGGCASDKENPEAREVVPELELGPDDPMRQPIDRPRVHAFNRDMLKTQRKALVAETANEELWAMHAVCSINVAVDCIEHMKPRQDAHGEIRAAIFAVNYGIHAMNKAGLKKETHHMWMLKQALDARKGHGDAPSKKVLDTYVHILERTRVNVFRIGKGFEPVPYDER